MLPLPESGGKLHLNDTGGSFTLVPLVDDEGKLTLPVSTQREGDIVPSTHRPKLITQELIKQAVRVIQPLLR